MRADIVIIGGGISGAAIAYNLAKKGVKNIVVVEKHYQGAGATSRCGAGLRQQWGTKLNCELGKFSREYYENAVNELDYHGDIEFKQGGYLILASTEREMDQFRKNVALQNSLGIKSQVLSLDQAKEIVPYLNTQGLAGATYCSKDGHLNPFTTLDAFIQASKRLGVKYLLHTEVIGINKSGRKITGVVTSQGEIFTDTVVNAAGAYTREIAQMVGVDLPTHSERHEILVTTPVNPILKPMVMSFSKNIYTQQVPHGSIIMGRSGSHELDTHNQHSTWQFLEAMAKTATDLLPPLRKIRVVRSWAGEYNLSPDRQPIYSRAHEVDKFYNAAGFSGHGFMFAPATGLMMSEMILGQEFTIDVSRLSVDRFKNNELIIEPSVV